MIRRKFVYFKITILQDYNKKKPENNCLHKSVLSRAKFMLEFIFSVFIIVCMSRFVSCVFAVNLIVIKIVNDSPLIIAYIIGQY